MNPTDHIAVTPFLIVLLAASSICFPSIVHTGEFHCDEPLAVIAGLADPAEHCKYMGSDQVPTKTAGEYMACALQDLFHGLLYPCLYHDLSECDLGEWKILTENAPILHEQFPETRQLLRRGLLKSLAYFDKDHREIFLKLMVGTPEERLWHILTKAADGESQALARAFYQWCDNYSIITEFVTFGRRPTLEQIIADREHPLLNDFGGTISCFNSQAYIYKRLERYVLDSEPVSQPYVELLTSARLRMLRNTIFAKYGREYNSADLREWFELRSWYNPDPEFTENRLSEIDRQNIQLIIIVEASRS